MCEHPGSWMSLFCWLANEWADWPARAVLLAFAAALLSLVVGTLARLLRFFQMDVDDIRRLPRAQQVTRAREGALTPDEPDAHQ